MMARKPTKKRAATHEGDITENIKSTTTAAIGEMEKAGELLLSEVKQGLGAVTDKISSTAKSVSETQFAQALKTLVDDVETIGNDLVDAVSRRLDQLRGKVQKKSKQAKKKAPATKSKAATQRKSAAATKKVTKKKVAVKKRATAKKKIAVTKRTAAKKSITGKKAPTKKKTSVKRRTAAGKKSVAPAS